MKRIFVFALFACFLEVISAVLYDLSDDDYYKMPPIVALDPYERCINQPDAVYCSAYFIYVADQPNPLLRQMQEYSEQNRTHFDHTRAFLGTCVTSTCKHLLKNSSDLESTLEACLNETYYEKYKLKVRLDVELFCISKDRGENNNGIVIDRVDIAVGIITMALVVLNIVGSYFDVTYSEESKNGVVARILLCFSLSRNWNRLTASSSLSQDPRMESLKGIHGIRAISTTMVIVAHSLLPAIALGENPEFIEKAYLFPPIHILLNGTLIMQTFLILSAFLLVYNLQILAEKTTITWKLLLEILFKRWIRLTPPYALILGLTATWLRYISNGPLWQKIVVAESNDCKKDWWLNIIYINNYVDGSHCMPQAWYLATDTQLYALGLVVYLLGRDLMVRRKLLLGLLLLGLVIPPLHTYFQDLEANLLITPPVAMNLFITDPTFNQLYRRGHTNLSGYVVGLALGYLVYHLQKVGFDATRYKKWRPIFWSLVPVATATLMTYKVFYIGPRLDAGYRALAALLTKPFFTACVAALMLGFFVQFESVYRGVVEWGGWRALSRVSYSAYLLHVAFIRIWTALYTDTFHLSYHRLVEVVNWMIMLTWLGAVVFWLTVEAPLAGVARVLLEPSKADEKKDFVLSEGRR